MEEFKEGEEVYKLPCNDNSHYFHIDKKSNNCECSGIEEWFSENNTCPICRTEFPYDEIKKELPPEIIQYPIDDVINYYNQTNNVERFINNLGQSYFHNVNPPAFQMYTYIPPFTPPSIPLISNNLMTNIVNRVFEDEEERQLQEAIELSLRD
tara:strand:+ start:23 stop:481 length:459 start_codon:yes stop_codon:yes gene_type:complete